MLPVSPECLKNAVTATRVSRAGSLCAEEAALLWEDLVTGSVLAEDLDCSGRSVLIATTPQLSAAALLVELDGVASRIVLYPPDLSLDYLSFVASTAAVDIVISDRTTSVVDLPSTMWTAPSSFRKQKAERHAGADCLTEWVLLTSGTTGRPKLVVHTFASLTRAIQEEGPSASGVVWSTFYDIRRYGGLQIFLRAALSGTSLVLSSAHEPTDHFLTRAAAHGVTHISGTPSHWRRAAMSSNAALINPAYVRLSGEIADQAILNYLQALYPGAKIAHAFATTEAGVLFAVNDGLTGFAAEILATTPNVEMKIENGSLLVRSNRTARCYVGDGPALRDADGFVNTGDVLEERQGRYYFAGRGDGIINVGGLKVHPEEVEAVINGHPEVRMSLVRKKKSAILGSMVVADVVLKTTAVTTTGEIGALHGDILQLCRESLDVHKVPAAINFVSTLPMGESGKLVRCYA